MTKVFKRSAIALCSMLTLGLISSAPASAQAIGLPATLAGMGNGISSANNTFDFETSGKCWFGGVIEWYYNPGGAPGTAPGTDEIVAAIEHAGAKWSSVCDVSFVYKGITVAGADPYFANPVDRTNIIAWNAPSVGSFANGFHLGYQFENDDLIDYDLSLFWKDDGWCASSDENSKLCAEEWFADRPASKWSTEMTSIMGRFLGLQPEHNRNPAIGAPGTLTKEDIDACASLYGASPDMDINRVFNWGEVLFYQGGVTALSGQLTYRYVSNDEFNGFNYRYYPDFAEYGFITAEKDGVFYILVPGQPLQMLGTLEQFLPLAAADGY